MGYALSWMAVKGADKAAALAAVGLEDTGVAVEETNRGFYSTELPTGWTLIGSWHFDRCMDPRLLDRFRSSAKWWRCRWKST